MKRRKGDVASADTWEFEKSPHFLFNWPQTSRKQINQKNTTAWARKNQPVKPIKRSASNVPLDPSTKGYPPEPRDGLRQEHQSPEAASLNEWDLLGEERPTHEEILQSQPEDRVEEECRKLIAAIDQLAGSAEKSDLELQSLYDVAEFAVSRLNDLPLQRRRELATRENAWPAILSKVHAINVKLIESLPTELELGKENRSLFDPSVTLKYSSSKPKCLSALLIAAISNLRRLNGQLMLVARLHSIDIRQADISFLHHKLALERDEFSTFDVDTYASLSDLAQFLSVDWPTIDEPSPQFRCMCELSIEAWQLPDPNTHEDRLAWLDFAMGVLRKITGGDFTLPILAEIGEARANTKRGGIDPQFLESDVRDGVRLMFVDMFKRANQELLSKRE